MSDSISPLLSSRAESPALDAGSATKARGSRQEIAGAAQQFEALMLNQLLQTAFASDKENGLGGGDEDQAGMQAMQLAQEQFAGALAARGGLGLAQMIVSGLVKESDQNVAVPRVTGSTYPSKPAGTNQ